MFQSLNKGISTPIAVAIILSLAILVGGVVLWQYSEIQIERDEVEKNKRTAGAIKHCEGLKEEIERKNIIFMANSEEDCYLVEAIKMDEKIICEKLEEFYKKCVCWATVDFFSKKVS